MKPVTIQIVPALAGFLTVYDYPDEKLVAIEEPIIAWRIETHSIQNSDSVFSTCMPITLDGDVASNCIGVQNPDNTVTVFEETTYRTLAELQSNRYAKSIA